MPAQDKLIVALDVPEAAEALALAKTLAGSVGLFKIGMELFYAAGPRVVEQVVELGQKVFLDLKLHDIPNTVSAAVRSVRNLGVSMLTLHVSGGPEMLKAARAAAGDVTLLGVTVLTSLSAEDLKLLGITDGPREQVVRLAGLAAAAGLDGVICSPLEAAAVKKAGGRLLAVTPGIRPAGDNPGDQKRVLTPREAILQGADYLVVGRPITRAADPVAAAKKIAREMEAGQ